jgi:small subunit ribosomal protein S1
MEDTSARTSPDAPPAASEQAPSASQQTPAAPETSGAAGNAASASSASSGQDAAQIDAASASSRSADSADAADNAGSAQDGQDADSDGEHEDAAPDSASAGQGAEGATGAKRKRRRRRKRKDGAPGVAADGTSSGDAGAPGAAAGEARHADGSAGGKKKESHAPFAHRFAGSGGNKRHAFAVGEVVAGRVQKVDHGVIVVDLFGKATAMADEYEPREVPTLPEPPAEAPAAQEAQPTAAAEGGEAVAADAAPADAPVAPEASAQLVDAAADAPHEAHAPAVQEAAATEAATVDEPSSSGDIAAASAEHDAQDAHDEHADHEHDHDHEEGVVSVEPPREKPPAPAIGQVFKGRVGAVSESGHIAILNRIIDSKAVRAQLTQFREQHKRVHGMVYGYNRGGFDVLVEGLRAFCPASAMSLEDIAEPLDFVGKKLEFLLPASKAGGKDIIVSRRSILERLQRRKTKEFLRGLTPGQKFKGKVTAVRDFGLFVDIGGVEGLVHQSELSFAFGVKPNNVAKVGDEIDVQVLRVGGDPKGPAGAGAAGGRDAGKRDRLTRVSLSVKALLPDPWDAHAAALTEGTIHKAKVVRAAEFGAFIEIAPEVEGLLHITELGRDLKHASQAVREGDEIFVAVERVDRKARRVSLSKLSAEEAKEFEAGTLTRDDSATRNLRQGNNVKVKIERIEPRCVFGRVTGTVGRRGRVFIPSSETGTERGSDLRKAFPIGTEIEAKIIGTDRDGSLKCSIKAMQVDEERQAVKNYRREAAKQGFGTFGDLLRAKLGEAQK